jgi:predicted flavoprotein YhiN
LDVDGNRGGYNLHFAWLSGIRVSLWILGIILENIKFGV